MWIFESDTRIPCGRFCCGPSPRPSIVRSARGASFICSRESCLFAHPNRPPRCTMFLDHTAHTCSTPTSSTHELVCVDWRPSGRVALTREHRTHLHVLLVFTDCSTHTPRLLATFHQTRRPRHSVAEGFLSQFYSRAEELQQSQGARIPTRVDSRVCKAHAPHSTRLTMPTSTPRLRSTSPRQSIQNTP